MPRSHSMSMALRAVTREISRMSDSTRSEGKAWLARQSPLAMPSDSMFASCM